MQDFGLTFDDTWVGAEVVPPAVSYAEDKNSEDKPPFPAEFSLLLTGKQFFRWGDPK